ncbi:MAG TPA: hypothetical protein VN461_01795 [Vicinamibacteria bacterium]|nr:hypothetical protein [Vicinamibacteria bacterium]
MRSAFAWLLGLGIIAGVSAVADPVEQQDANPPVARVEPNPVATSAATEPVKVAPAAPATAQAPAPADEDKVSPLSFKIGSTEFAPFGFVDLTGVYRSTNVGSGIGTSFGGIPFASAGTATGSVPTVAGNLSEVKLSPQNSRFGLRVTGKINETKYAGYFEGDFLGFQVVNSQVTSNSYTFRMRNYFAQIQSHSVELVAGQAWSLMTPNRNGISPYTDDIFYGREMDTNYLAGLVWARQPQVRVGFHFNDHAALAVAAENPQQFIGAAVVLPSALASTYGAQFDNNTTGNGTPNQAPDFTAKLAFDGGKEQHFHFEVAGVVRSFKAFNPANGGSSSSATGAAGSVGVNFELAKGFFLIANGFTGKGGGRYIFGLAPDLIVNTDGTIQTVKSSSTVDGLELHVGNVWIYGYYSGLWIDQTLSSDGKAGFGTTGAASANHRVEEYTFGVNPTFWRDKDKKTSLGLITQYSYLKRTPWSVPVNAPTSASTNMLYVDVRFTLP